MPADKWTGNLFNSMKLLAFLVQLVNKIIALFNKKDFELPEAVLPIVQIEPAQAVPEHIPAEPPPVPLLKAVPPPVPPAAAPETDDIGPPYLFVDVYWQDLGGHPPWAAALADRRVRGAILKATEGTAYPTDWFKKNWRDIKSLAGARYGKNWFRGCYHYLDCLQDPKAQAEYYLRTVALAGGWDIGDIIPIVDLEGGKSTSDNNRATASQIIDCTQAFVQRILQLTGQKTMLYGRGLMAEKKIRSKMGCSCVWDPAYTKEIDVNGLEAWTRADIWGWQDSGDGVGNNTETHLPLQIQNFGPSDITVVIDDDRPVTMDRVRSVLRKPIL